MLEERVVGTTLRWRTKEVASPLITLPRFAVPLLDGVRRIGEDHVEGLESVAFDQSRVMKGVAAADVEVGNPMQYQVHAGYGRGDIDEFLAVETDGAGVATIAFHLGQT